MQVRSPIAQVSFINTPVFLLHRDKNPYIRDEEVNDFVDTMKKYGKECYLSIKPKTREKHYSIIDDTEIIEDTDEWIESHMKN